MVSEERREAWQLVDSPKQGMELYDLATLFQHGAGAFLNYDERLSEYQRMLEDNKVKSKVKKLLFESARPRRCPFQGVTISFRKGINAVRV